MEEREGGGGGGGRGGRMKIGGRTVARVMETETRRWMRMRMWLLCSTILYNE